MRRNVHSSAVFTGGRPLCTQILPEQGRPPSTILGIRKLEILGYPRIKTACLYRFDTIPECDGHTEGRTDGPIYRSIQRLTRCKNLPVIRRVLRLKQCDRTAA